MDRTFFVIGSISGFLAVALGAFGAHLLRDRIGLQLMGVFETGQRSRLKCVRYSWRGIQPRIIDSVR